MDLKDFEKTLNYCLYICDDDDILIELSDLQIKKITRTAGEKDFKRVIEIEKLLQKQFRD